MNVDLTGKVAVVTGASRGIGAAIARKLDAAGASIGLIARNQELLGQLANELENQSVVATADVSNESELVAAIGSIEASLGSIDVLVNNAGITRDGLLVRISSDDWNTVLDVNLKGAFLATKTVGRGMMKRRSGRIINITSVVGITGNKGQASYAASKSGLIGFTKSIAKELASRNVLVNAIAPGFIETEMTEGLPDGTRDALLDQIPLGRLGSGDDVASVVLFLASDMSGYITGQVVVVDGGMVM